MCLTLVSKIHKPALAAERFAYKVFVVREDGEYAFEFCSLNGDNLVPKGKLLRAASNGHRSMHDLKGNRYPFGFHCFTTKKGAMAWAEDVDDEVIVRVRIRGIKAVGKQRRHQAIIAREMFVSPSGC